MKKTDIKPVWEPSEAAVESAQLTQFARWATRREKLEHNTYADFYQWSVDQPEAFWSAVWEWCGRRARGFRGKSRTDGSATAEPATR